MAEPQVAQDSPELTRRSIELMVRESAAGAVTAVAMGALLGLVYVPAVGWAMYLAWFAPFAAVMAARGPYMRRLLARGGYAPRTLMHVTAVVASTSWLAAGSVALFAPWLNLAQVGLLSFMVVGWAAVAVTVLAVQPRVYAVYLVATVGAVYAGWVLARAAPLELLFLGLIMVVGGRRMIRLAHVIRGQLHDSVAAGEQNASLVGQLREALRRQEEAQRARSRFLGAASHDLRQPVQALLFLSDTFRKSTDPARRDAMALQIARTGESIDTMFRHLVDFAQIDAGTMRAVLRPVELERLVQGAAAGFAEKCAARGLGFQLAMDRSLTAAADPVLLERMLRNFLDNAYKYSLQGQVRLEVRRGDGEAVVTVADQGIGMTPEELAQACNAFYRAPSASRAEAEGIGLGLAISRHMADLMDARLELASKPGEGTRVCLRLRLAE